MHQSTPDSVQGWLTGYWRPTAVPAASVPDSLAMPGQQQRSVMAVVWVLVLDAQVAAPVDVVVLAAAQVWVVVLPDEQALVLAQRANLVIPQQVQQHFSASH